ncbi:MAG: hypothetical protein ACREAR_04565 [Nitrosotalea sp.]
MVIPGLISILNIIGLAFQFSGFILVLKSTIKLTLKSKLPDQKGMFDADQYVDPKTGEPPIHIESSPRTRIFKPGVYLILFGITLQIIASGIDWH